MVRRRSALVAVLLAVLALAAAALWEVLGTVFFALTVAYVLAPLHARLRRRGLSRRLAALASTTAALVGALLLVAPVGVVLLLRIDGVLTALAAVPETIPVDAFGYSYSVVIEDVLAVATAWLTAAARAGAAALPTLTVKFSLFVLVVYAMLYHERAVRRAAFGIVPPAYTDVAEALHERAAVTLNAIYLAQAATALGTFLLALPTFYALGYDAPLALATLAGVLQFVPVLGPSVLIGALALYHVAVGEIAAAVLLVSVGGVVVAVLPDLFIRPWLAAETGRLPGSLYFIGFVGGALTLGAVGVVAGPLVVAVAVETVDQVAADLGGIPVREAE